MDNIIYVDFVNKKRVSTQVALPEPKCDKQVYFEQLMDKGMVITISMPDHPDAKHPDHLNAGQIVLKWSYRFDLPDLTISHQGISATLTFSGMPHKVNIPWESVVEMHLTTNPDETRRQWRIDAT